MGVAAPSPFPVTFSGSLVSPFRADGSEGRGWGQARRGESASRAPIPLHLPRGGEPCGQLPPAPLWLCVGRRRLGWGRGAGESLAGAPVFLPPVRGSSRGTADASLPGILLSLPGHPHARRWGGRKSKRLVGAGGGGGGGIATFKLSQDAFFRAFEVILPRPNFRVVAFTVLDCTPSTQQA